MKLIIAQDHDDMSKKAANILLNQLALKSDSVFGLATGSTPIETYQQIIENYKNYSYDFSKVRTFNLDEYFGLAKDHHQSYYYFMWHNLFKYINIKKTNIHLPDGLAKNPEKYCAWYEQQIKHNPIDLQILGLGENGHIAFNEPGSSVNSPTRLVDLTQRTILVNSRFFKSINQVPTHAITMGIGTILKAKKIIILASGQKKAQAVKDMLEGSVSPECPASFLRQHPGATLIVDPQAARLLSKNIEVEKNGWTGMRILTSKIYPKNKKILVISPHHDDSAVSCGAAIRALSAANKVTTLVMTAGYHAVIGNLNNAQKIKLRKQEAVSESKILGNRVVLSQFQFYDHAKKYWTHDLRELKKQWFKVKPQIVILPQAYDEHITHVLSSELVTDFIKKEKITGIQAWFYEGLWSQHLMAHINLIFSFDKKMLQIKNKAIQQHKSQMSRLVLDKASQALSQFRAETIPELKFAKHGEIPPNLGGYLEAYQLVNY